MRTVQVNLGPKSYDIEIERGLLDQVGERLRGVLAPCLVAVISDSHVAPLYAERLTRSLQAAGYRTTVLTFAAGEGSKNIHTLGALYDGLAAAGVTRSDAVIALGGGVTGDMGGLAAATFLRGIRYIQIPTSLLAQVDSSVGGKVAIDLPRGKNLVGAFYQPAAVYIDPDLLATLPVRFLHDGLAEVIKYGCIRDAALFALLERCAAAGTAGAEGPTVTPSKAGAAAGGSSATAAEAGATDETMEVLAGESKNPADRALLAEIDGIVETCCAIKARIVEADEFDTGERMVLNFGHTLGHAVEKQFQFETYSHGEGVSVGMNLLTARTEALGLTASGSAARLKVLCAAFGLPLTAPMRQADFVDGIRMDKKKQGSAISLVVMREIGWAEPLKIDFADLPQYIEVTP